MAAHAWRADLKLMLRKNKSCWSYKVIDFIVTLGLRCGVDLIPPVYSAPFMRAVVQFPSDSYDYFCSYHVDVDVVIDQLRSFWFKQVNDCLAGCPRSTQTLPRFNAYMSWVGVTGADYMKMILPSRARKSYIRFRLGAWNMLEVNKHRGSRISRNMRFCRYCNCGKPEDEFHVLLECTKYIHIRNKFANLPFPSHDPCDTDMLNIMQFTDQRSVVLCVHAIYLHRLKLQ